MNLKKISGYRLKYIALFPMFLDHIGVIGKAFLSKNVYFLLSTLITHSAEDSCFRICDARADVQCKNSINSELQNASLLEK